MSFWDLASIYVCLNMIYTGSCCFIRFACLSKGQNRCFPRRRFYVSRTHYSDARGLGIGCTIQTRVDKAATVPYMTKCRVRNSNLEFLWQDWIKKYFWDLTFLGLWTLWFYQHLLLWLLSSWLLSFMELDKCVMVTLIDNGVIAYEIGDVIHHEVRPNLPQQLSKIDPSLKSSISVLFRQWFRITTKIVHDDRAWFRAFPTNSNVCEPKTKCKTLMCLTPKPKIKL